MNTTFSQMERLLSAIERKEDLQKFVLALKLMKEKHIYAKYQMTLFSTISFDDIMKDMHSSSLLIACMYDTHMFEFLFDNWKEFTVEETIALIKKHLDNKHLDKIPLNIKIGDKTLLDMFPDLRQRTNQYLLKASSLALIENKDPEKEIDLEKEINELKKSYDYNILYTLSQDIEIDMEAEYKRIRDKSFSDYKLFQYNYKNKAFKEKSDKDPFITKYFMTMLRQYVWNNMISPKLEQVAIILQCMGKTIEGYDQYLNKLNLGFLINEDFHLVDIHVYFPPTSRLPIVILYIPIVPMSCIC